MGMTQGPRDDPRALQARLDMLDLERRAVESWLHEAREVPLGEPRAVPPGGDRDVIHGIYIGERPEFSEGQIQAYRRVVAARTELLHLRQWADPAVVARSAASIRTAEPLETELLAPETSITAAIKAVRRGDAPGRLGIDAATEGSPAGVRPVRAAEAAILHRCQVLLGPGGAGKSVILAGVAHALASRDDARLSEWPAAERGHLPILVSLPELALWSLQAGERAGGAGLLWSYVAHDLRERNLSFAVDPLRLAFESGEVVILLDELDRVPEAALNPLRASIEDCARRLHQARMLVACREDAYRDPGRRLDEGLFPRTRLAPLSAQRIDHFIDGWCAWEGAPGAADERAGTLRALVRRPDLWELASSPLLLTLLLLVEGHRAVLPQGRAALFEETLEILLWLPDRNRAQAEPSLTELLRRAGRDRTDLLRVLQRLAFSACTDAQPGGSPAGISEAVLVESLRAMHPQHHIDWAQLAVDQLKRRTGLFDERQPGMLFFVQRSLGEYLSGVHLAHDPAFPDRAVQAGLEHGSWRGPLLCAADLLVRRQRQPEPALLLAERLCPPGAPGDEAQWRRLWLAAEVLLVVGSARVQEGAQGPQVMEEVRHRLTALVERGVLDPRERAAAGDVLARLADPRFDQSALRLPSHFRGARDKSFGLVPVMPGPFPMGNDAPGPRIQSIEYGYWIGRYPVTVGQFAVFMHHGGYDSPQWWPAAGWDWCRSVRRAQPEGWDAQRPWENRPVTGVSWFEAMAYADWLDAQVRRRSSQMPDGYVLRLPTEAEWEKAACGAEGRAFPWGSAWEPGRANVGGEVGHPSAVGMYPAGGTPDDLFDLAGNVLEWCLSVYAGYPYRGGDGRNDPAAEAWRVLRGGSWRLGPEAARCSARRPGERDASGSDVGLRLVLSVKDGMV